ncbi:MAG: GNAT family N-acetyltransferase [Saprospiraceae bacterium]
MIETTRLLIRPFKMEDATIFFEQLNNSKAHLENFFFKTLNANQELQQTREYILQKQKDMENKNGFVCCIFKKDDLQLIGSISVRQIDWVVPKGELAYYIFKPFLGQKYATEALTAFRDWCFTEHQFNRLYLRIATDNLASIKTAEKCGFKLEGVLKNDYRRNNKELIDMNIYGYVGINK